MKHRAAQLAEQIKTTHSAQIAQGRGEIMEEMHYLLKNQDPIHCQNIVDELRDLIADPEVSGKLAEFARKDADNLLQKLSTLFGCLGPAAETALAVEMLEEHAHEITPEEMEFEEQVWHTAKTA